MRDSTKKYKTLTRRAFCILGLKTSVFGALLWRFYDLQILQSQKFATLSEKNRLKINIIPPIRGMIKDRNNVEIVGSAVSYAIVLQNKNVEFTVETIKEIELIIGRKLKISDSALYQKLLQNKLGRYQDLLVDDSLSWPELAKIELQYLNSQNAKCWITKNYKQRYYFPHECCHVIGYASKPSAEEVKSVSLPNYKYFNIGKDGVEKSFDSLLQGEHGVQKIEINSLGENIAEVEYQESKIGQNLILSLDIEIQKIVMDAFHVKSGTALVMCPFSGDILSMYSAPSYDPNQLTQGIKMERWNDLIQNPLRPLLNRAIGAVYPPGSIFKIITALAILRFGIDPNQRIICTGRHQVGNKQFHCWKEHGSMNFDDAIAQSCNVYFYINAMKVGIKNIHYIARLLGLGKKTEIALPSESSGLIPTMEWKYKRFGEKWQLGDTVNSAIGQGYIQVTALQLALMMSKMISGYDLKPNIVLKSVEKNEKISNRLHYYNSNDDFYNNFTRLDISSGHIQRVFRGLNNVFKAKEGSGYKKKMLLAPNIDIAGKTGTAQIISRRKLIKNSAFQEHGLFLGFAPYHKPKYIVMVVAENSSWGSVAALPIACKIFQALLDKENGVK